MKHTVEIGLSLAPILAKELGITLKEDQWIEDIEKVFSRVFPDIFIVKATEANIRFTGDTTYYAVFDTIDQAALFKLKYL